MKIETGQLDDYCTFDASARDEELSVNVTRDGINGIIRIRFADVKRCPMTSYVHLDEDQAVALHQLLTDALNTRGLKHDDDRAGLPLPEVTEVA